MTRLHHAILRAAALLVHGPERAEWLAEWSAELCYVDHGATVFCLGAFRDALWLRRNRPTPNARRTFGLESPLRCLFFLATLAAVSTFFAFRLPFARDALLPSPYRDARHLVMISAPGHVAGRAAGHAAGDAAGYYGAAQIPTIRVEQYRTLASRARPRFTALAFYCPIQMRAQTAPGESAKLSVAVASANLFQLLQIPISSAPPNALILSDAAWRKFFEGDPHIMGRILEVAGRPAVVAGVIPASSWRLPGRMDAWLLQDEPHLAALPANAPGFVLGHLTTPASQDPRWPLFVPNEDGGFDRFACWPLAKTPFMPSALAMIAVSLLVLSATTPLTLGEYPADRYSLHGAIRMRRWFFLAVKILLLLPIVLCGSLDVASLISMGFEAHGLFVGVILALRWAVLDQRQRCPVCLRSLSHPTRIGDPSQTFLEWYGTELMCDQGHGLLYVPEIPTSCYSTQRWQYLDPSWSSLFS